MLVKKTSALKSFEQIVIFFVVLIERPFNNFVGCYLEVQQDVWTECYGKRDVGGVAAVGNQYSADAGIVVARIEHVPPSAEKDLNPCGEILRRVGGGRPMSLT